MSIVGIDRVPFGYYKGKLRQEELLVASGLPYSILRATQFHEFFGQILDRVPGPIAVVPKMRTQPVAAAEVGQVLVKLAATPTTVGRIGRPTAGASAGPSPPPAAR